MNAVNASRAHARALRVAAWATAALLACALPTSVAQEGRSDGPETPPAATSTGSDVQLSSEAFRIGRLLRCPVCVSESVGDSSSAIAVEMRTQIEGWLSEGYGETEILGFFQERYGDWILLEPPRRGVHLVVWWLPGIVLVAGATTLVTLMARWIRASRAIDDDGMPSGEERARIDAALRDRPPADGTT